MVAVLVSGAPGAVSDVAGAMRTRGAEVTEVTDLGTMAAVCASAGPGAFDSYVQLPASFAMQGDTAIRRVHHFYAGGVLARFPALADALPALSQSGRVTFVLGHLPGEVASQDDREARQALVRLLCDAARADFPNGHLAVQILAAESSPDEIATAALGGDPVRERLLAERESMSYQELRIELLGMVSVET
jgi:hypothetical protein